MKRLWLPVLVMLVFLVAGCGVKVRTYTEADDTISVKVDREFVIALDSNPTTGYSWEESHDGAVLSLLEKTYQPSEEKAGLVGAGGTQYFRFEALKTGKTQLTLVYKRPWEKEISRQKVLTVDIK